MDGHNFPSLAEANYFKALQRMVQIGEIKFFLRQVPLHLPAGIKLVIDFVLFYADEKVRFVDVKGMETNIWKLKKKQVEALYPINIEIVKTKEVAKICDKYLV
jgi:hypothetical protein